MDDSKLGDGIELFGAKFPAPWRIWSWPADGPTTTPPPPVFAPERNFAAVRAAEEVSLGELSPHC